MTFALAEKQLELEMLPQVRSLTYEYLGELSKSVIMITNRRPKFHKLFTRSLLFAAASRSTEDKSAVERLCRHHSALALNNRSSNLRLVTGAPGRTRTDNIQLRRLTLYPVELRARAATFTLAALRRTRRLFSLRRVVETNEGERQTAQPPSFALTPVLTSAEASLRRFCSYHRPDLRRRAPGHTSATGSDPPRR